MIRAIQALVFGAAATVRLRASTPSRWPSVAGHALFAAGAYFAYRSFDAGETILGTGFTLFALAASRWQMDRCRAAKAMIAGNSRSPVNNTRSSGTHATASPNVWAGP